MLNVKVLFLDTTIHKKDATGITISNLFSEWPKSNLYMIGDLNSVNKSNREGYINTYLLSNKEKIHLFPLSFFQFKIKKTKKKYKAKQIEFTNHKKIQKQTNNSIRQQFNKLKMLSLKLFNNFFTGLGLNYLFLRVKISNDLDKWIEEIDPDFFYALLSTRHSILFANQMAVKYNKPLIIHIMDDWPFLIGKDSCFSKYWNSKINNEFENLLKIAHKKIAISNSMAQEYKKRYGGNWDYFHNPITYNSWFEIQMKNRSLNKSKIKIGYFGRIGKANKQSVEIFIDVIGKFEFLLPVEFHIYTKDEISIKNYNNIFIHSFIDSLLIPAEMSGYNFLLLPISFLSNDKIFAKYSIPTKLSEYLISGVPIIVLAPRDIALTEFVKINNCGLCINSLNMEEIFNQLYCFFNDEKRQNYYTENGKIIALNKFEINIVSKRFNKIFESSFLLK